MPKETIYGGTQFALDPAGNEWPILEIPPGTVYTICQRGLAVHWGRDADRVELGVSIIETSTGSHASPFKGAFMDLDERGLATLIKTLQRAGRQAFGEKPW